MPLCRMDTGEPALWPGQRSCFLCLEDTPAHTLLSGQALATRSPTLFPHRAPRAAHSAAVQWPVLPGGPVAVVTETLSLRPWTSFLTCLISYGQPLPHSHAKPLACQQTSPPQTYPSPPPPVQPSLQLCLQLGRSFLLPSLTCNPLPRDAHLPPASLPRLQPSLTFHPGSPPSWAERSHCCDPTPQQAGGPWK